MATRTFGVQARRYARHVNWYLVGACIVATIFGIVIIQSAGLHSDPGEYRKQMLQMVKDSFTRAIVNGQMIELADPPVLDKQKKHTIYIVIDRLVVK